MMGIDNIFKGFFLGMFTVIFIIIFCNKCSNHKEIKPTNKIIEEINDTITKVDTLIKTKTIVRNKEVEKLVPYQHIVYVTNKELCKDTTKLDSLKTLTLSQSKIIKDDSTIFVLFNKKDSLYVKKDSLNKIFTDSIINSKDKYWKGYLDATKTLVPISFGAGVIIGVTIKK